MKKRLVHTYHNIISPDNLLAAWQEFLKGKKNKPDVQAFELHLMDNLFALHQDLKHKTYEPGGYQAFKVNDPKPRDIHKASVRDRLVHHAIYRILYSFFDRAFIADSYSCRNGKGTHKALNRFRTFARQVSCNRTKTVWILKCDVRKCFASIDQTILLRLLRERIADQNILWLLGKVIQSFHSNTPGRGLPLGNLTSQLLVNVYLNELDQFVKHRLRAKHYIRYADDLVLFSRDYEQLECFLFSIREFLYEELRLTLHPNKISIETVASGIDFLGWIHFPDHRVLRTMTKRRMLRKVSEKNVSSYLGMLRHGNGQGLERKITDLYLQ